MLDHHVQLSLIRDKYYYTINNYLNDIEGSPITNAIVFADTRFPDKYNEINDYVLKVSHDYDLIPFFTISHKNKNNLNNLIDKFRGLKINLEFLNSEYDYDNKKFIFYEKQKHTFDDILDKNIMKMFSDRQMPIIFHTDPERFCSPREILRLKEKYEDVPMIIAHFAKFDFESIKRIRKYKDLYLDISGLGTFLKIQENPEKRQKFFTPFKVPKSTDIALNKIVSVAGEDRIVWGSDSPWCKIHGKGIGPEIDIGLRYNFHEIF